MEQHHLGIQYKVGLFIGLGLLATMVSILLLGGDKGLFTRYVNIRTQFSEVQGLFPGSVVSLAGIPVGNVKAIEFSPKENKLEVVMKIDQKFRARLTEGMVAEVRTQGALGDKYVYLTPGETGAKQLKNNDLITGNENDYLKLLTDREDGIARVVDLIKEMHILVASINQGGRTNEMMRNMADASVKFKSTVTQLDGLLGDLRGEIPQNKKLRTALVSLSNILEKVDQGKGTIGQLINDPTVAQSLKAYLGGSPRTRYMKDMLRETIQKSDASP